MKHGLGIIALLCLSIASVQGQAACETQVAEALALMDESCADTGRNQVCYGHLQIEASGRTADFRFEQIGDLQSVDAIEQMRLAPYDAESAIWGLALMRLQANLPDTLPGQNVTVLALGDVTLTNNVLPLSEVQATLTARGRARSSASSADNFNVVAAIEAGASLTAIARNESGDWLYLALPSAVDGPPAAWISTQVLSISGDASSLPVVASDASPQLLSPMQAFTLSTGISAAGCQALPPDGLIVQTPRARVEVSLTVNGVEISLGSTAFLQTRGSTLAVALVEGRGRVSANGVRRWLPPGTEVIVPLNESGTAPIDAPSEPQPYDGALLARLPIVESADAAPIAPVPAQVITPIEAIADPVAIDDIPQAVANIYAPNGLLDGWYRVSVTNFVRTKPEGYTDGYCFSGGTALQWVEVRGGRAEALFAEAQESIRIVSIDSFAFENGYEDERTGCQVSHFAQWSPVGPIP